MLTHNAGWRGVACCLMVLCAMLARAEQANPDDWPLYGNGYHNQRYSPLQQINQHTVGRLQLAWKFQTGIKATFQSSPLVIDGVMYLTTPYNHVLALDAADGRELWRYRHRLQGRNFCCGPANRGAAIHGDRVFTLSIDARLIALRRTDGKLLWERRLADTGAGVPEALGSLIGQVHEIRGAIQTGQTGYSANMAPQVHADKVFVGITGAGYGLHLEQQRDGEPVLTVGGLSGQGHGLRGFLVAYDARNGKELWRWYSVPGADWHGAWREEIHGLSLNRDIAREKATVEQYRDTWKLGGGSIWTTPAVDPELGLIYLGTGNPSPQMDAATRPGDNLYTVSLVALEMETGTLRWHYQYVPHDRWGYDAASPPVLFEIEEQGQTIPAVGHASKLGWFFIHDRRTGKLIRRSQPFIPQENLFATPSATGTRIVPGTLGATSWSPAAYDRERETIYIAGIYQPSLFISRSIGATATAQSYTLFQKADEPAWGNLSAISVHNGQLLWQQRMTQPMVGGVLATAGGLVFSGDGEGKFHAFASDTGKPLWQYQGRYGVNAPPISYAVDGRQHIAVASGGNRLFGYPVGDEVLVFTLPR